MIVKSKTVFIVIMLLTISILDNGFYLQEFSDNSKDNTTFTLDESDKKSSEKKLKDNINDKNEFKTNFILLSLICNTNNIHAYTQINYTFKANLKLFRPPISS